MTEYDWSPEALDAYNKNQIRIAKWVDNTEAHQHEFRSPFGPASDSGHNEYEATLHVRQPLPHRRSSSVGLPVAYTPTPSPPAMYPGVSYPAGHIPGPMPAPPQMVAAGGNYPQYSVSPPPTIMAQGHSSLYRSQSHDNISHHSKHSHSHSHSHRSHKSKRRSRSPTYVIQTSPTYTPMVSPPLSTAGTPMWYPQTTAYSVPQQAVTPPRVLSPTGVPYAYPYAPAGMHYPYSMQQQVQAQPQYVIMRDSKSRKSSKSRKVIFI